MAYDVLYLSQEDVKSLGIGMKDVIEAVEHGLKLKGEGKVELPPKPGIHPRKDCYIHAMPCWIGGEADLAGVKWVAGFPSNLEKNLPYNNGIFCLNDTGTGVVKAIMDANWMTTWRTGAAAAIGAKYFSAEPPRAVSVIGLGTIGKIVLRALKTVFPGLSSVKLYDPLPSQNEKYTDEMSALFPDLRFENSKTMKEACADADLVTTNAPILEKPERPLMKSWLKPDCLCISSDYDSTLHADVAGSGKIFCCDDRGQYLWTQGHGVYFQNGYPVDGGIYADLGDMAAAKKPPVTDGLRVCVFMGIASHDVMTAGLLYKKAVAAKAGQWLKL
ncbi:MAG: ornithine cyclodeaminase family protein [Synergistaceae bacterium]|nr:ornithine cyclodeaminase family protein [Synergistaceae bacterium]